MLLRIRVLIVFFLIRMGPADSAPPFSLMLLRDYSPNYFKSQNSTDVLQSRIIQHQARDQSQNVSDVLDKVKENNGQDTVIIFMDSDKEKYEKIVDQPKCANEFTFCENIDTYPTDHVKYVLSMEEKHKDLFGIDEGPIEHRVGEDEDHFICASIAMTVFPKVAKTRNKVWKYVVNQGDYVQGVRIEKCIRPRGSCNLFEYTPTYYTTSCKQKYIYRRLVSLSDDGVPVVDQFELPSACCCAYKRDVKYAENYFGKHFTTPKL